MLDDSRFGDGLHADSAGEVLENGADVWNFSISKIIGCLQTRNSAGLLSDLLPNIVVQQLVSIVHDVHCLLRCLLLGLELASAALGSGSALELAEVSLCALLDDLVHKKRRVSFSLKLLYY